MQINGSVATYLEVFILNSHLAFFEFVTIMGCALAKYHQILIKNKFYKHKC